uniref:Uncharacterized protein n=1 Tax=Sphaerodactylus townsendi TaxID=933632 RepID=A0ACB8G3R6_9SAUR
MAGISTSMPSLKVPSRGMEDNTSFEEDATQIDESHWRGSTPAPGNLPPVCGPSEDSDSVSPVRVSNTTGRLPTPSHNHPLPLPRLSDINVPAPFDV